MGYHDEDSVTAIDVLRTPALFSASLSATRV